MFRPSAYPLVTVDPYFSIWSFSDKLYDKSTYTWHGRQNGLSCGIEIDGTIYYVCGLASPYPFDNRRNKYVIEQIDCKVEPLRTSYLFRNDIVEVSLEFITPLLINRPEILSRPVSYVEYNVKVLDNKEHKIKFRFDISSECCVDSPTQEVILGQDDIGLYCENKNQNILNKSGDHVCIDWGRLYLICDNDKELLYARSRDSYRRGAELDTTKSYFAYEEQPLLAVITEKLSGLILLAYDEINPIEYYGNKLKEYYISYFDSFADMVKAAKNEYKEIKEECIRFGNELYNEALEISEDYANILSLIYRQVVGSHKLIKDTEGNILFISKECDSNGCAATLDVTYPSIPLFLKYNTEFVKGMLRPIIKTYNTDKKYDGIKFCPHDSGRYPLLNGEFYRQFMPVEECGNFIITTAAICKKDGNNSFAIENAKYLQLWVDYLLNNGYDPGEQLCTDDFAGKLAHNCNLSVKSIVAIAAYGKLFGKEEYYNAAKEMAKKWEVEAKGEVGTILAFGNPNTWSLKYNMVWDKILGLNLFSEETYQNEIKQYMLKMEKYGMPLDNREKYTKIDWIAWTTMLTDNKEYTKLIYNKLASFISETNDRVPVTDWYYVDTGIQKYFQNRTVLGALFINIMNI